MGPYVSCVTAATAKTGITLVMMSSLLLLLLLFIAQVVLGGVQMTTCIHKLWLQSFQD